MRLDRLSNEQLIESFETSLFRERKHMVDVLLFIREIEHRRLYAELGFSSLFSYLTSRMNLSEHQAYLRIFAARKAKEHPLIFDYLKDGKIHLSSIKAIGSVINPENAKDLLDRISRKSKSEIERIVVIFAPKEPVKDQIRKLPQRKQSTKADIQSDLLSAGGDNCEHNEKETSGHGSDLVVNQNSVHEQ